MMKYCLMEEIHVILSIGKTQTMCCQHARDFFILNWNRKRTTTTIEQERIPMGCVPTVLWQGPMTK